MKILFVAAECAPFAKVGGLADVVPALARALKELGVEAAIFIPRYRGVEDKTELERCGGARVPIAGEERACVILRGALPKGEVPVYFLDYPPYFDRPGIYGEGGEEYPDSLERFALLSRVALELPDAVGFSPDVLHVHDWHAALVPVYARTVGGTDAAALLTIHNLAYQGTYPRERAGGLGLPAAARDALTHRGRLNLLYGGIVFSDLVNTVSPTYAREIQEDGEGLEDVLRERARRGELVGILNGVDYEVWDPETDPHIWAHYSPDDPAGKVVNKERLQRELGLAPEADVPLVGMISRLVDQKGLDLVMAAFERMMSLGIQFVLLGTGDPAYEEFFRGAARRYPGRAAALIAFSEEWAHRIEAAADIFLMPSKFEPCGLNQMYSLRYGTVPVVRATGGLRDTVREYDPGTDTGNGFVFEDYSPEAMLGALRRAVDLYREDREAWRRLMVRGMREDHSWGASAREYLRLYRRLTGTGG
ncbi:MAG: glycogen synthase GlgA [Caldiserica bacterium]|nr:glycogen synthase GlgA [Caldisericota bacterium]